jgi:hypothetical protein
MVRGRGEGGRRLDARGFGRFGGKRAGSLEISGHAAIIKEETATGKASSCG